MGASVSGMEAAGQQSAEALLGAFQAIGEDERSRHAAVCDYWLSIRGDRDFPTIRDLDPLQISDAGPCSVLLELIGGGEDAEIRHIGENLKAGAEFARIAEAPRRSLLSCIASKLAIVAISRDALAFEDEFETTAGTSRCRVTLLPFSSTGPWVDYVYGFVTSESAPDAAEEAPEIVPEAVEQTPEIVPEAVEQTPETAPEAAEEAPEIVEDALEEAPEVAEDPVEERPEDNMDHAQPTPEMPSDRAQEAPEPAAGESSPAPSESPAESPKGFDPFAGVEGFFGNVVNVELDLPATAAASREPEETGAGPEGTLQGRLAEARAKADEARLARLRSDAALCEGLSAAYDFALDAEDQAEDYLKLVEAQGLKIQLRSPMAPVVRLAFEGRCEESTIAELERVLAWALKMNLPRGSLAERIESEGGIAAILGGPARDQ
ncbi:MAG TPA: hypothetical protein VFU20_03700 [Sphingomicrobium sp.]|nr:hypothetical protein [Sphingomicrobium sp.]